LEAERPIVPLATPNTAALGAERSAGEPTTEIEFVIEVRMRPQRREESHIPYEAGPVRPLWVISIPGHEANPARRFELLAQLLGVVV
jgi:hypothetical protein